LAQASSLHFEMARLSEVDTESRLAFYLALAWLLFLYILLDWSIERNHIPLHRSRYSNRIATCSFKPYSKQTA
jgi:hypothetical protein